MKKLTVYECPHCKKLFRTPDRHDCKKNPAKRNCFSCKWLYGWTEGEVIDVGFGSLPGQGPMEGPYPECKNSNKEICMDDWDLESIKSRNYNMQCKGYEQGEYFKDVFKVENIVPELSGGRRG